MPAKISLTRKFSGITYRTHKENLKFETKEAAKKHVKQLKATHDGLRARVVERADFALIYVQEDDYRQFLGDGESLPATEPEKVNKGKIKPEKSTPSRKGTSKKPKKSTKTRSKVGTKSKTKSKPASKYDLLPEIDRYYAPPPYLYDRLTKEGQKAIKLGVHEIQKLPLKKLDRVFEVLGAEIIKFDPAFEKEAEMRAHIENRLKEINQARDKATDQISQEFLQEKVELGIREGKFNDVLDRFKATGRVDDAAYDIFNNLGRNRKKWPFTEVLLLKKIQELLRTKYPGLAAKGDSANTT